MPTQIINKTVGLKSIVSQKKSNDCYKISYRLIFKYIIKCKKVEV
jgi:hypothetical protein